MLHINCRERGYYSSYGELSEIVTTRFLNTVACVGSPKIRFSDRYVQVTTCLLTQCSFVEYNFFQNYFFKVRTPFTMFQSEKCKVNTVYDDIVIVN